jgi:hypothetical protein
MYLGHVYCLSSGGITVYVQQLVHVILSSSFAGASSWFLLWIFQGTQSAKHKGKGRSSVSQENLK